jgi:hypothetical protein
VSVYAAPDAVGMGAPPGAGGPPSPGDPASMAALAAVLQGGAAPGTPDPTGGLPPGLGAGGVDPGALAGIDPSALAGAGPGAQGDQGQGSDLLSGMNSTDHIRAAIKHLMMAMTESQDDQESAGITKGMAGLHAILAGKAKDAKTIAAAGG